MAAKSKTKSLKLITPITEVKWVNILEPATRFDPAGVYSVDLVLDPNENPEHASFIGALETFLDDFYEETISGLKPAVAKQHVKHPVVKEELDEDGEPTGLFILRCKQRREVKDREGKVRIIVPTLVDSRGNKIADMGGVRIGNGSLMRVKTSIRGYVRVGDSGKRMVGLTAGLNVAQLVKLEEFGDEKMEAVEDGYIYNQRPEYNGESPWDDPPTTGGDEENTHDDGL